MIKTDEIQAREKPAGQAPAPEKTPAQVVPIKGKELTPARFEAKWVPTRNERNFELLMAALERSAGEGRLAMVIGPPGYGKTRTAQRYAAHNRCIYLLVLDLWRSTELGMLQALCREIGIEKPPARKNDCFLRLVDHMVRDPKPVFLDEMDLCPQRLNLVRQLSEVTAAPFVLIGETALCDHMTRERRVWSRTYQNLVFERVVMSDVIFYGRECAGLEVSVEAAAFIDQSPLGGDWRDIRRVTMELVEIANTRRTREVSEEMAKLAVKLALKGSNGAKGKKL